MASHTVQYFSLNTVEKAILNYFNKNGISEEVRDRLMVMETEDGDAFFQMVADYVENKG